MSMSKCLQLSINPTLIQYHVCPKVCIIPMSQNKKGRTDGGMAKKEKEIEGWVRRMDEGAKKERRKREIM